jgi:hypothetical protein
MQGAIHRGDAVNISTNQDGQPMARRFCLLPQGYSEAVAQDCKSHRHLNAREVTQLKDAGDIERIDEHPVTQLTRYIARAFHPVHVPGAAIAQRAAGVWKEHAGEVRWAKGKIQAHAPVLSWIRLERLFYDDDGLRWSAKPLAGMQNVEVLFSVLDFEPRKSLEAYLNWTRPGLVIEIATKPKVVSAMKRWQWRQALTALDRNWGGIVSGYRAGQFSAALTQSRPSDLPSLVFRETLEALV